MSIIQTLLKLLCLLPALLAIFLYSYIASPLNAQGDIELFLASGEPLQGLVTRVIGEQVMVETPDGKSHAFQFEDFATLSQKQVLDWAFEKISSTPGLIEVSSSERQVPDTSWNSNTSYSYQIRNRSPMGFPASLTVAYNVHNIEFQAMRSGSNSGRFSYEPIIRTTGYLASFEGLPAQGLFDARTEAFSGLDQSRFSHMKGFYTEEELNPGIEVLLASSFRPKRTDGSRTPPSLQRIVFELRIMFEGELLYRYLDQPEFADLLLPNWTQPSKYMSSSSRGEASYERARAVAAANRQTNDASPVKTPSEPELEIAVPSIPYESIVIINVDGGVGTGFLVRMKGRDFMATNIHVIAGSHTVDCQTTDGTRIYLPETFFIAKDRDLAIFPVVHEGKFLELETALSDKVKIGDEMTVFGNEAGASVITECTGTVKGIGPSRIETDAKFIEGNSGSPALHHAGGKVIGIAAYYIEYEIPEADRSGGTESQSSSYRTRDSRVKEREEVKVRRRFAERLDNVKEWEKQSLESLANEDDSLSEYTDYIASVVEIAVTILNDKRVLLPEQANAQVQRPLEQFHSRYSNTRNAGSDGNKRALAKLKSELSNLMDARYRNAQNQIYSSYYKAELVRAHAHAEAVNEYMAGVYSY
jgi:hypothetical protein